MKVSLGNYLIVRKIKLKYIPLSPLLIFISCHWKCITDFVLIVLPVISQTAGSINAPNQKCQDGMTRSGNSGGSKLEMQFCKKGPLPLSIIKEKYSDKEELSETSNQELDTRERQKTSEPCSASASFELHKEFSIDDEHEDDAHGAIEAVIRTEHLPYHSRTRSSRPLSDKKDEHPCSLKEKETISRCQTIMRERYKSVKGNSSDIPISKVYPIKSFSFFHSDFLLKLLNM